MRLPCGKKRLIVLLLSCLLVSPLSASSGKQQSYPEVPRDLTRVYYLDAGNKLAPLPFEKGITPVNVFAVARDDKTVEVEVSGARAATVVKNPNPVFYVFVADRMDPPPHLLVRLVSKKSARRFIITTIKERKGYAPLNEENIRLDYRILERLRVEAGRGRILFVNYMEIHPRQTLTPGEYAIIGDSLEDVATFRIE